MKKLLSLFLLVLVVWGCETREVDLMPIDLVTGGKEKEWKLTEYSANGKNSVETDPCLKNATIFFSKGNPQADYPGPYYQLRTSPEVPRCGPGATNDPFEYIFFIADDGTYIDFYDNIEQKEESDRIGMRDPWLIYDLTPTNIHMATMDNELIVKGEYISSKKD